MNSWDVLVLKGTKSILVKEKKQITSWLQTEILREVSLQIRNISLANQWLETAKNPNRKRFTRVQSIEYNLAGLLVHNIYVSPLRNVLVEPTHKICKAGCQRKIQKQEMKCLLKLLTLKCPRFRVA